MQAYAGLRLQVPTCMQVLLLCKLPVPSLCAQTALCAELVNKLQRHPSSGRDDIKVLLRVLRDEIGRAYFKRYAPCVTGCWCLIW